MKTLKKIGFVFFLLSIVLVVASFFLPSKVHVERSIEINASPGKVYSQVRKLEKWENWSPWAELDSNMKVEYGKDDNGNDFYTWDGNEEVRSGKLTIVDFQKNESIDMEFNFGARGMRKGVWNFEETEGGVKVTWSFDVDVSSPMIMGKYFGLMMDGMLGSQLEIGLDNIKHITDKKYN